MHRRVVPGAVVLFLVAFVSFRTAPADDPLPRQTDGARPDDGPVGRGLATGPEPTSAELLRRTITESVWPTDAGRVVTSTFGEFRSSHFHAGIDISTDVTGYRVFAARDGYVSRISVSAHGYGKMLVVTHPDGYSTLYAHLSGFAGAIAPVVRRLQDSLGRYTMRRECAPGELPVTRGQLIAYTGDTGVGTPHLHFEIRDEHGDPVNPLQCEDFQTADDLAPIISRVAVIPIGESSTVNGGTAPVLLRNSGRSRAGDPPVRIEGRAAFAVEARDPVNGTHFRRSAYRHTLTIDDRLFFATSLDRVDGRYLQLVSYHYDWPLWHEGSGRYERLFVPDSLHLPSVRDAGPADGIIGTGHLTAGLHRYRIVSEDFNGNSSSVEGMLQVAPRANDGGPGAAPSMATRSSPGEPDGTNSTEGRWSWSSIPSRSLRRSLWKWSGPPPAASRRTDSARPRRSFATGSR